MVGGSGCICSLSRLVDIGCGLVVAGDNVFGLGVRGISRPNTQRYSLVVVVDRHMKY